MMVPELPPGTTIEQAHRIIVRHASDGGCGVCLDTHCPSADWALRVVVAEQAPPDDRRLVTTVARLVARAHLRALRDARERGMTDRAIHRATGIPPGTFHRWQTPAEGGLPKWEKVDQFFRGLDLPSAAAAAALGIAEPDRPAEPEPFLDPDLQRLGRILRDPRVPESEKQAIRHTIRMLARASRTEADA